MSDFRQDDNETPVLFRRARGKQYDADGVTAVFPCEPHSLDGTTMSCYAIVGQHGGCSFAWYRHTRAATPEEYASLKAELEGAPYGYRLKVYSRMTRQHRAAFKAEVQRLRKPWSVADTTDTYEDEAGRARYRVKARFASEQEAVHWLATQDQDKVARGDFEICGP